MPFKLEYDKNWNFDWPHGPLSQSAVNEFYKLIDAIASGMSERWGIYETFKSAFGNSSTSSNESWAETDMGSAIRGKQDNAALFVVSFCNALDQLQKNGDPVPSVERINDILERHQVPLHIDKNHLTLAVADIEVDSITQPDRSSEGITRLVYSESDLIGQGGFGSVYRARRSTSIGSFDFAIKVFDPSPFQRNRARCEERFRREVAALIRLQHRAIVPIFEAGFLAIHKPYLLMPLINGTRLDEFLKTQISQAKLTIFCELAKAVCYAHENGVLHRDLKPSNVLVRESDVQPIILDFGCAFLMDNLEQNELTTTLIGSEHYIPPEVRRDPKTRDPKQDIYAIGVMLYDSFANNRFSFEDYRELRAIDASYEQIDRVVRKATDKSSNRYPIASDLVEAIAACDVQSH
jgi:Protein kinase domain